MKTGCLFKPHGAGAIAISRSVPKYLAGTIKRYEALAPPGWMQRSLLDEPEKWQRRFRKVVLARLDPQQVWAELHELAGAGNEPVLCCWERLEDEKEFCHRTEVARWLEDAIGQPVHELPRAAAPRQLNLFAAE